MLTLCSVIVYICMCTCIVYTLRSNNVKCQCNINPRPTSKFSIKGTFFKKFRLVFAAISVKTFPSERRGWAWCKLDGKGCYSEAIPPPPPPARGEQPYSGERQQRPRRPDRVAVACRLRTAPAVKYRRRYFWGWLDNSKADVCAPFGCCERNFTSIEHDK